MTFAILGPLRAWNGPAGLPLGPYKQRLVLGLLLCRANRVVSVTTLTDAVWDGEPPRSGHKNLQAYVSALRRIVTAAGDGDARLGHTPPGYTLTVGPEHLDALEFEDLAREGRRAMRRGDTATAADRLGRAVRLWRGPVLPDLVSAGAIAVEARALRDRYLAAYEDWAEAKLAIGDHADLLDALDELTRRHPFRERLRQAHMLALYRAGRPSEALARFDEARQRMARELGLQPSPVLLRLYESILVADPGLDVAAPTRPASDPPRTAGPGRTRLTRDIADFTGRADEVDAVVDLLSGHPTGAVVAVTGPAGAGKTTLAVHCAHRLGQRFPDGRVMVGVRSRDGVARPPSDVLADLLRALRPATRPPDDPSERAALVRDAAAGRRVLLLLDDAVSEAQVRELVFAVGETDVIVTSRRRLSGLEPAVRVALEPLPDEDAWRLLARLIGPDRLAAEPAAAGRLVRIGGGSPLLLRIIGTKLHGLSHLSLSRYAQRFAEERGALDELSVGDIGIRHRLAVADADLAPADRVVLRRLALMPSPTFTVVEAARRLGTDARGAEIALERLLEAHLVAVDRAEVEPHGVGEQVLYRVAWPIRALAREPGPDRPQ
jgi:DNA-binding SARP family transcriptional activator